MQVALFTKTHGNQINAKVHCQTSVSVQFHWHAITSMREFPVRQKQRKKKKFHFSCMHIAHSLLYAYYSHLFSAHSSFILRVSMFLTLITSATSQTIEFTFAVGLNECEREIMKTKSN